ncbi:MAG: pyruvate kinase [Patescibacteria group bacterium]|nr:hypothetical protein [Patescibacteria group bacterium]
MEKQQVPEILVTLPGDSTREFLEAHINAGATGLRIHTAKMASEQIARLVRLCQQLDLCPVVDLAGNRKARTLDTPGMVHGSGLESQNKLLAIERGNIVILVPASTTNSVIANLQSRTQYKYLRVTAIPALNNGDMLEFADGKVACNVIEAPQIEGLQDYLAVTITEITNTAGIFWRMGITSSTNDLFSAPGGILSEIDLNILQELKQSGLTKDIIIALSFVSYPGQITETIKLLEKIGFKLKNITLQAKIETIQGAENVLEIVNATREKGVAIEIEIARGDLAEACKLHKRDLYEVQTQIINNLTGKNVKVIIATGVAESAISKIRESGNFKQLSSAERRKIVHETLYILTGRAVGWMLAGETMITGQNSVEITRIVRETYERGVQIVQRFQRRI